MTDRVVTADSLRKDAERRRRDRQSLATKYRAAAAQLQPGHREAVALLVAEADKWDAA